LTTGAFVGAWVLASRWGLDQGFDDGTLAAGSVQRLLDGEHLGIVRRALDEVHHASERVVGVVDQHVLRADHGEDVVGAGEGRRGPGHERLVAQCAEPLLPVQRHERREVHRPRDPVHVAGLEIQRVREHLDELVVRAGRDLQPHGFSANPLPQGFLDGLQQVLGLVFVDHQVGVAGHAENRTAQHLEAPEQLSQACGNQVLQ